MAATSPTPLTAPQLPFSPGRPPPRPISKELHFNRDLSATRKLQAGVDLVANLVGVTLGPKGRNVVLGSKYGPPRIVNDGETVLKEVELEDPLENVGVKLVRQAGARTNDLAGDGCTTSIILAQGLISEGVKVLAAGMNPVQVARGIEKTAKALVSELKLMSREIEDQEIANVAAVSAGNDYAVGSMIAEAVRRVGRKGVVRIEDGRSTENSLQIVEGMQFDRGYLSPYFVTNRADMLVEFNNCKVGKEVLGSAVKVIIGKDSTLIVTDGSTQRAVEKQVAQIRSLEQYSEEKFQKKILNERIARLCGGIAIIQVGAQTVVELKDKKLRIEDSLNATKAAIEEGVVVGGGCTLLRLSTMVDGIKDSLDNEEQKIGADIFKRALSYPAKLIAKNAGVNGDVIVNKVLSNDDIRYGYNAAMNCYEDLVAAGILDPSKVVRCCLEHAAATAKTFLTSDLVVVDVKGTETISMRMPPRRPMPMSNMMRTPDANVDSDYK
ncbi:ruBisCO large subunit-binding protein subunit beta [Musa troglodytarum]|uniref:RuBisCO large subunit-binding protein subunit beta n=1 Tax=Musa troglodytarum TaxID=320322 RepID=A0A9E7HW65_9LILI|nr:ruBisCO large subunit-binding protein subunit beta [Musa troglodytarum]